MFHQDNAPAHRTQGTIITIDFKGLKRLDHIPYSPDLAPMDFAIFPKLKGDLRVRRFEGLTDLKRAVQKTIGTLSEDWFSQMYVKWVRRHDKYVTAKGEYFEKNVSVMTSFRSWCPARTMVYDLYVFLNICVYQLCKTLSVICKLVWVMMTKIRNFLWLCSCF